LLGSLIELYANQRKQGEHFGDFMIRSKFVTATLAGNRFHADVELVNS
jgi:sulfite reductase (NADPH) hemoprotein beta-component